MNIVVLDGYTLNPGDLDWDGMRRCGSLTLYDRTPPDLIVKRSAGATILITNKVAIAAKTLEVLPELRYIGVAATGYNIVDVKAAVARGIFVTNIPTYGTDSVAQMVFALLFEMVRGVRRNSDAVRAGEWTRSPDFCFWRSPQIELAGKTIGIIGFGRIGRQVARIADAFGMRVMAADSVQTAPPKLNDFAWSDVAGLLKAADVVSLHCPLTSVTKGLIACSTLGLMKPTASLVNTSRGPLVEEADLAEALNSGRLAGAGLDVLSVEPPPVDNPLLSAKNCLITPHISWATFEARSRLMNVLVENVRAFLAGRPLNVVTG